MQSPLKPNTLNLHSYPDIRLSPRNRGRDRDRDHNSVSEESESSYFSHSDYSSNDDSPRSFLSDDYSDEDEDKGRNSGSDFESDVDDEDKTSCESSSPTSFRLKHFDQDDDEEGNERTLLPVSPRFLDHSASLPLINLEGVVEMAPNDSNERSAEKECESNQNESDLLV